MNITPELVRELFDYSPESGVLTWKRRGGKWFKSDRACNAWNARFAGKRAGFVDAKPKRHQCRQVGVLGGLQLEHRVIWVWMTGEEPPDQIDHRNRDATDNRWRNLRASNNEKNSRNRSKRIDNRSGVTGVGWLKSEEKWMARCCIKGKSHYLGLFKEIDEAALAVLEFRAEHGFDPRHGIEIAHYHRGVAA